MKERAALWLWRVAILALLAWIGDGIRDVHHAIPAGMQYETQEQIRSISIDAEKIERNTRR